MESEQPLGLAEYLTAFKRHRWLALVIWILILIPACILAVALPSIYTSTATFQLKQDAANETRNSYIDQYVNSLTHDVIASADVAEMLRQSRAYPSVSDVDAQRAKFEKDVRVDMVTEKILDPQTGHDKEINSGFSVTYSSKDPEAAQKVAAWLAQAFITVSRQGGVTQENNQAKFFAAEAERVRTHITETENKLAAFKEKNIGQLPDSSQSNMAIKTQYEQALEGIDRDMRAAQQNRIFLMQQLQQARASSGDTDNLRNLEEEYRRKAVTYDENHPDMIALRRQIESLRRGDAASASTSLEAQLATQRSILAETRQRYSDDHPDVQRLKRTIKQLETRIAAGERVDSTATARTPIVAQLETQLNAAESQIGSLEKSSAELRGKISSLQDKLVSAPQVERDYDQLTRDVGTAKQQYDQLINKRMEAEVAAAGIAGGTADQFRLIGHPQLPLKPSKPARLGIVVIGFIGATMLALILSVAGMAMDATVRGSRDVVNLLSVAPIGIIPEIRNAEYYRRRLRRLSALAASIVIGVPVVYIVIRFAVS